MELLAVIPSLLLVQLFRRLRPRHKRISPLGQALHKINASLGRNGVEEKTENKSKCSLRFPWWCIFIAYGLCVMLVGMSILFIIARGIEFGDLKTQQWLGSILTGFFSSVLLTQPLKVSRNCFL